MPHERVGSQGTPEEHKEAEAHMTEAQKFSSMELYFNPAVMCQLPDEEFNKRLEEFLQWKNSFRSSKSIPGFPCEPQEFLEVANIWLDIFIEEGKKRAEIKNRIEPERKIDEAVHLMTATKEKVPKEARLSYFLQELKERLDYISESLKRHANELRESAGRRGQVFDYNLFRDPQGKIWEFAPPTYEKRADGTWTPVTSFEYCLKSNHSVGIENLPEGSVRSKFSDSWAWETFEEYKERTRSTRSHEDTYYHIYGYIEDDIENLKFLENIFENWTKIEEWVLIIEKSRFASGIGLTSYGAAWKDLLKQLGWDRKVWESTPLEVAFAESINEIVIGKRKGISVLY